MTSTEFQQILITTSAYMLGNITEILTVIVLGLQAYFLVCRFIDKRRGKH